MKQDPDDYDVGYTLAASPRPEYCEGGRVHKKSKATAKRDTLRQNAELKKIREEKAKYNNQYGHPDSDGSEIKSDYSFDRDRSRAGSTLGKKNSKTGKRKDGGILKHPDRQDKRDKRSLKYN